MVYTFSVQMESATLDRNREPTYYQIRKALLGRIESGEWGPGTQLPTELQLQQEFGVSRGTVRRALDELAFAGRISRHSGRGTFVKDLPPRIQTEQVLSFTEQVRRHGWLPSTRKLSAETLPASEVPDVVRQAFGLGPDASVVRIRRLRLGDGRPLSIQTVYLLPDLCPGVLDRNLGQLMPLYESFGWRIHHADEVIRVITVQGEEARLLGLNPGDPAVYRFRISFLEDETPFEVLESLDCHDTFEHRHRLVASRP
jgi:GntR family transcriptional regulator